MKIKWRIENAQPEYELLTVAYSNDDGLEYWKNFNPREFSAEEIVSYIEGFAPHVVGFFERVSARKADVMEAVPTEGEYECDAQRIYVGETMPDTVIPEEPEYDPFTQRLELSEQEAGDPEHSWSIIDKTEEEQLQFMEAVAFENRLRRNQLLLESDFFNFPDACVANVQDWLDYRQALRDVPGQPDFPKKIIWPERPEVVKEETE